MCKRSKGETSHIYHFKTRTKIMVNHRIRFLSPCSDNLNGWLDLRPPRITDFARYQERIIVSQCLLHKTGVIPPSSCNCNLFICFWLTFYDLFLCQRLSSWLRIDPTIHLRNSLCKEYDHLCLENNRGEQSSLDKPSSGILCDIEYESENMKECVNIYRK